MSQTSETSRTRNSGIPWQAKISITIVCGALLASGVFYGGVRNYLHSDGFRLLLSEKASRAIGTEGKFGSFRWDGLALESASFTATGKGPLRSLQMDGLRTEIGLGGLKNGVWEINGSKVHQLNASFDFNQLDIEPAVENSPPSAPPVAQAPSSASSQGWLPRDVKFDGLQITNATIHAIIGERKVAANNLRVDLKSDGQHGHSVNAIGGILEIDGTKFPSAEIKRISLKHQNNRIYLNHLELSAGENARLEATGEIDNRSKQHSFDGGISGVKCSELLRGDWVKRLSGDLETTFSCNNHTGTTRASGKLELKNGNLTAFPALDALATFSNTQRFRSLAFNDARSDWRWQDGKLVLENIVIASDGAIRAEGTITVDGEQLDGHLNIGLPPEVIAKLPSAAGDVFNINERGMRWAPVRVTGTTKKPKEDLSGRLMGAAAAQLIGQLREGIPAAGENAAGTAEEIINSEKPVKKGVEAILNNSKSARQILNGLLQSIPAEE